MSIGRGNRQYIPEIFEFCRENAFSFGINPVTRDLHARHDETEVDPKDYLDACRTVFDLWFQQRDRVISANPANGVLRHLLSRARLSVCSLSENCQHHFISVGPEGDVYPCNRFYGVQRYRFGNLLNDGLDAALASSVRQELVARSGERITACATCDIRRYCNGGCMHHALAHHGELLREDHLCEVYRGIIGHALKRLSEVIGETRKEQLHD